MMLSKILPILLAILSFAQLEGCAKDIPRFVPPSQRMVSPTEMPLRADQFFVLAYHDVEDKDPDQAYVSVSTEHLKEQFKWLEASGYHPVSVDQILDARAGGAPLPEKAVLLTFDDGYSSFYTHVYPLLKAYNWPAVLAPVGKWMDTPLNQPVDFGGKMTDRKRFLTWDQITEMSRSGLVEVGAHTNNLHFGIVSNPQGNLQPAAATRAYDKQSGQYESDDGFRSRIANDVAAITRKITQATGKKPRVWVWPYGAVSGTALDVIKKQGYIMALTLEDGAAQLSQLMDVPRMLVADDPSIDAFANAVTKRGENFVMRVAHVDLDYVYDPDPAQMDRNVGALVQRIYDLQISTVFLQAFADPEGDGLVKSVYFRNGLLPMRADLFNRVAWQLKNRAQVNVYAWLPVLSYELDANITRVQSWNKADQTTKVEAEHYRRLSPFDSTARKQIISLYEDLARYSRFDGILFHDDAILTDFEDASPPALEAYRQAGLPTDIERLRADPQTMQAWTRFKSRALTSFTETLATHVKNIQGNQVKTARNIFAEPILRPDSEQWFAQNLDDFLATYEWTAPMAMPYMENVEKGQENAWLDSLVDTVAKRPGALAKTVFEIQGRDWRAGDSDKDRGAIDSSVMAQWLGRLQLRGANNFGYYPDDYLNDQPKLKIIRPAISNDWYPY